MENTNEIMETIDEAKETAVEAVETAKTSVGKVVGLTMLGCAAAAGLVYAGYKGVTGFLAKKAKASDPVDVDYYEEDVEDSEE